MNNILKDKVCIVTGGGKGIGLSIVEKFMEQGAQVSMISRTDSDVQKLEEKYNGKKHLLNVFCGDVTRLEDVDNFMDATLSKFGHVDVLVNNAGMRFRKSFLEISTDELMNVMNVNFISMFQMCQKTIPHFKNKGGKIINMTSIAGNLGLPYLSAYVCSKAAIIGMTKSLALEFAEKNILVNAIAPGFCKSSYYDDFKQKEDLYKFTLERTPLKRWGECDEIANASLFLASDLNTYMSGEVISVDGGWSAW